MTLQLTPAAETYMRDWAITLTVGGIAFLVLGLILGWLIWRKSRQFAVTIETDNRLALADFERTSDEVSKLKAELFDTDDNRVVM